MDRRKKRTSTNQYMIYIDLMEKDQIFASGKVPRDVDVHYLTKKWKELSDKLNQCNSGPTLTAEEWRKRLNDWKNTTRSKYRRSLSGDKDITMSSLEMKALELFGKNANSGSGDQISLHLKSEKDENEDEMEHQRSSDSFHKELQAAVEEAIGGDEDDAIVEEHEEEFIDEPLNTSGPITNSTSGAETGGSGTSGGSSGHHSSDNAGYRTIVVENASIVDDHGDDHVEFITSRRVPVASTSTAVTNTPSSNNKLINGGIPIKRLRTHAREQIVYEVKNAHVSPQAHTTRNSYSTMQTNAPIAIHQKQSNTDLTVESNEVRDIGHQLKRLADIKYEKLKFEIARFKFNNPGFQYNHPQL